jgi:hypothetical protein
VSGNRASGDFYHLPLLLGEINSMTISTSIKRSLILTTGTVCIAIGADMSSAHAATFSGADGGVDSSGARPNSNNAASQFDTAAAALGTINLISFESLTAGSLPSPSNLPGVTISGTGNFIANDDSSIVGFNTTSGGSKFLQSQTNLTTTFAFANPIQAFGAYITGLGTSSGQALLEFNDGSNQSYNLSNIFASSGGAGFFGFTEAGKSIASVAFVSATGSGADVYGIDDVRFVSSAQVPAPALLPGLIGLGMGVLRKRKAETAESDHEA